MNPKILAIKNRLAEPLPGRIAQFKMSHIERPLDYYVPDNAMKAAVMLLIYPVKDEFFTLLIERTSINKNDKHSGQISFPGGKLEKNDASMEECAKREAFEEVGVAIQNIEILGALTTVYIPVSNFHVFPFVGYVNQEPEWHKQQSEVVELLKMPLYHFLDEENKGITSITIQSFTMKNVPYYEAQGRKVWGATAAILSEMNEILKGIT